MAKEANGILLEALKNNNSAVASDIVKSMTGPLTGEERKQFLSSLDYYSPKGDWIPVLEDLSAKNPDDAEFLYYLSKTCWRAGDEESALKWGAEIITKAPRDTMLIYRAAAIAYAMNRYDRAKEWIERVLTVDSGYPDAIFLLGCILARQGESEKARDLLLKIVKENPNFSMACFELGKLANQDGQSEEAEAFLRQAIEGYPFFRQAMNALMIALARQNKKQELERLKPVFERLNSYGSDKINRIWYSYRNPSDIPNPHAEELAAELTYLHREDDAKKFLERRLEIGKSSDLQLLMLARLYFNDRGYSECMRILKKIQSPQRKDTEIYIILWTWSLYHTGKVDEAQKYFEQYESKLKPSSHIRSLAHTLKNVKPSVIESASQEVNSPPSSYFQFADVTQKAGLNTFRHILGHSDKRWITDAMGSGVAVGDFDNDGDDDIYFVCGRPELDRPDPTWRNALFRNDGGVFTDVTEKAGVGDTGFGMCALFGDVNGDGWNDLFVGNHGANVLYKNNGDGTFTDITAQAGIADAGYAAASAFTDIDRDGDLDLYVGNYVAFKPEKHGEMRTNYHGMDVFMGPLAFPHQDDRLYINDGKGVFEDSASEAGINASEGRAMGAVFFDIENDGDPDLYVTNDSTYNHVLKNSGDGTFEDISFLSGGAFTESGIEGASMGVVSGDYDNDGYADLFITSYERQSDILFHNNGECLLSDVTAQTGLNRISRMLITWGSGFCDFDADGWLDLFTANGHLYPQVKSLNLGLVYEQGLTFYRNNRGRFTDISARTLPENFTPKNGRGAALIDYDSDGDMDIVINCIDSSPMLLENRTPRGNWLQVDLKASSARKFGVRVVARQGTQKWTRVVDGGSSYLSQNSSLLHFGFGDIDALDDITVYWNHGEPQVIVSPKINTRLSVSPNN